MCDKNDQFKIITDNILIICLLNTMKSRRVLINHQQKAFYRKVSKPNWVVRRGGGLDENITLENRSFLDQVILDKYAVDNSPLKEAPWKRGQFDKDSV